MKTALKGGSGLLLLLLLESEKVAGGPVDGMKCNDGTILKGDTGPERYIQPNTFCKLFPKHPWQYPPLGFGQEDKGVKFPYICDRIMGGKNYDNSGKPKCPNRTADQSTRTCMTSDVPKEILRDMACAIHKDPAFLGKFMNNKNKNRNLIEFAAFMAHVGQETGDLRIIWEGDGNAQQYCEYFYPGEDKYCKNKKFFGRGVHQLTHPSNYSDFSNYWFKDRTVLLENPELILSDMELSWGSAIWFWMDSRHHHNGDGSCGKYTVQHEALFEGLGFGETISTINGIQECGIEMPWVTGKAVTLPPFFTQGCSAINKMELVVKRSKWTDLEEGGDCTEWNEPYPCGWGGVVTGNPEIPNPLTGFKKGANGVTEAPKCPIPWDQKPDKNSWPYYLAPNEGYHTMGEPDVGGGEGGSGGGDGGEGGTGGETGGGGETEGGGGTESGGDGGESGGGGSTGDGSCSARKACIANCQAVVEGAFASASK